MFICAADTHLQVSAWSGHQELAGDSLKSFGQIVDHTVNSKAKALVLPGDILDCNRPSSAVVNFLLQQLAKLRACEVPVYFVQGQHCRAEPCWLQVVEDPNVIRLTPELAVELEKGVVLSGADHMPAEQLQETLKKIPKKVTHLVLHQMLKPLMGWNMDLEWVPEHVKLVLLGDYHRKFSLDKAHYPGSTCMQAIDEPADKYFFEVTGTKVKPIQLNTRPFMACVVTNEDELSKMAQDVMEFKGNEVGNPLVLIRCGFEAEKVFEEAKKSNPEAIIMLRALPTNKEQVAVSVDTPTLEGCLDAVIDSGKEPELRSFLVELMAAPDARDVIESKVPG